MTDSRSTDSSSSQPSSQPPAEVPAIVSVRVTAQAVHLVVSVDGDWDLARSETVAEAEQRCESAQEFAESERFRNRYPGRVGVVRLVVKHAPPEIVREVLTERGVEIELLGESASGDKTCALCKREKLAENVVSMTDEGWACPSCFRAWLLHQEQAGKPRSKSRLSMLSSRLIFPLLLVVVALFVWGVLHELKRLNQAGNVIRQHLPTQ